jgi:Zn-dependent M28 family amino/carboxypeptidase
MSMKGFLARRAWFWVLVLVPALVETSPLVPRNSALVPVSFSHQAAPARPAAPVTFDGGRAYEHLRQVVNIGPRPAGSPGIERTRAYITTQLKAMDVVVTPQPFDADTPIGRIHMVNLIATIPGARKERIALAGHYDTKLFQEFRFVGANDGGSSTAVLLEMARVFKARSNAFTVELLFLDGEEATRRDWGGTDHTYGSQFYVDDAVKKGTLSTLKALVLVDMVGDRSLRIMRETASTRWLSDAVWRTARRLGYASIFVDEATRIEDDHMPFLAHGVPSVDIIDLDYSAWHTADDTLDQTSARSLEVVGKVVENSWKAIERVLEASSRVKQIAK